MSSLDLNHQQLVNIFNIVGFEGHPEELNHVDQNLEIKKVNNTAQEVELDPDIAALLGDKEENLQEEADVLDVDDIDEEEVYSFLDDPKESKKSRVLSRVKQKTEEEIVPIENNIIPNKLVFNINFDVNDLSRIIQSLGEEKEAKNDSNSFLDEQKQSSRLMSRIKQHEVKEVEAIENYTIPEKLFFNLKIEKNQIVDLFKKIGENLSESDKTSNFLDEQSKNSRLMSRIKQHEVKDTAPIENYTLPKSLNFNLNLSEKKLKYLIYNIGD